MSLYDAAKDALKIAQKADNIDLIQKLLDVQESALDMQAKQQELQAKLAKAEGEIASLKTLAKFKLMDGHTYMIDQDSPQRSLCPVCTMKNGFAVPLLQGSNWCAACSRNYK